MADKPKDDFVERTPTPETHVHGQPGVPSQTDTATAEPKKAAKQDVTDRKAAEWVNPLDDTNNDPRVKEIRAAQEKEMLDYQKNYKKNVAKKDADA